MYDELVRRLNAYSAEHENHGGITAEAADAIEELQQTAKHYKGCSDDWYKEACDYKAMLPRWIPVTERLPEGETDVIVAFDDGEVFALWQNWKAQDERDEPLYYMTDPFSGAGHTVTHWMPLPEPPKEET